MAYRTFTLEVAYPKFDGQPAKGTVEIECSEQLVVDAAGNRILSGNVVVKLDDYGAAEVTLPDPSDENLNPVGWGFTATPRLHHGHLPSVSFGAEAIVDGVVRLAAVTPVDPSTFDPEATYASSAEVNELGQRVSTLEESPGGVTSYNDLTDKPTIPTTAADLGALAVTDTDTQVATLAQDPLSETGQALSATYAAREAVAKSVADAAAAGYPLDDFRDVGLWEIINGTRAADSTDTTHGPAVRVKTNSGATAQLSRDMGVDLRGRFVSFWIKPLDANFRYLHFRLSVKDRSYYEFVFSKLGLMGPPDDGVTGFRALPGRWQRMTVSLAQLDATGVTLEDAKDIRSLRIDVAAQSGTVTEALIADLRFHDQTLAPGLAWVFDDAFASVYDKAFPILGARGIVGSTGVIPSKVGTTGYATVPQLQEMVAAGWETQGHDNQDYAALSPSALTAALRESFDTLKDNGLPAAHFVYTGGSYSAAVIDKTLTFFRTARSIASDPACRYETPFAAPMGRLRTLYISSGVSLATAKGWLDKVKEMGAFAIITWHDIVDASPTNEAWTTADFTALADYAVELGLANYTMSEAYPATAGEATIDLGPATASKASWSAGGTSFAAIGNSIEEGGTNRTARTLGAKSYVNQMALRSAGKLRLVTNAGVSGETTAQMLARFDAEIAPYAPRVVLLGSGENDLKTLTPAQTIEGIAALVAKVRAIGALPVLHTTVPRGTVVTLASITEFNWRLTRYAQAEGIPLLDFYGLLVSESDGTLYADPAKTSDGSHPTNLGAAAMADYALPVLLPHLAPSSLFLAHTNNDPFNLFTNGLMLTDGNADGVPDGWTWNNVTGITKSLVTASGVPGKMFQFDNVSAATRGTLMQSVAAGTKFAAGDKLAIAYRLQAEGAAVYNGVYGIFNGATGSFKSLDLATGPLPDGVGYYEFTVPAGCTSIDFYVSNDPGVGKLRFGQATLRNLTANSIA